MPVINLIVDYRRMIKVPIMLPEIVGFLKIVGKIQQLVRKRSQKNN